MPVQAPCPRPVSCPSKHLLNTGLRPLVDALSVYSLFTFYHLFERIIMAYNPAPNTNATSAAPVGSGRRGNTAELEKAIGFLNIYVPTKGGGRRKVGAGIPLNASKDTEKAIFEWLTKGTKEDQAAALAKLMSIVQIEFNPTTDNSAPENQIAFE